MPVRSWPLLSRRPRCFLCGNSPQTAKEQCTILLLTGDKMLIDLQNVEQTQFLKAGLTNLWVFKIFIFMEKLVVKGPITQITKKKKWCNHADSLILFTQDVRCLWKFFLDLYLNFVILYFVSDHSYLANFVSKAKCAMCHAKFWIFEFKLWQGKY